MSPRPNVTTTESPPIHISDSFKGYPITSFNLQHVPARDLESVLIPGGLVRDRIERLGFDISSDFAGEDFTFLCVLKGGFQFFNQLLEVVRQYHRFNADQSIKDNKTNAKAKRIQAEFIRLISYEDDASKGDVRIIGLESLSSLKDKNVIIVEDIIDSGLTMQTLLRALEREQPKLVKVASLFFKRTPKNTSNYYPDCKFNAVKTSSLIVIPNNQFNSSAMRSNIKSKYHIQYLLDVSHLDVGFSIPDSFIVGCNLDYNNYFRDLQVSRY